MSDSDAPFPRELMRSYMGKYLSRGGMAPNMEPPRRKKVVQQRTATDSQVFRDASGKALKRPAIQGFACLYNVVFRASGHIRYIEAGAFITTICDSSKPKRLLFDHDDRQQIGSTELGLEFANTLEGLAFRMPLEGNVNAGRIIEAVNSGDRACVSIGGKTIDYEQRKASDGTPYVYCSKMDLNEISLVAEGAVTKTYARVVDLDDEEPMLWKAARQPSFHTDQAVANALASAHRLRQKLEALR